MKNNPNSFKIMRQVYFVTTLEQQIIDRNLQKNLETAYFLESIADVLRFGLKHCPEFLNLIWIGIKLANVLNPDLPDCLDKIAANVRESACLTTEDGTKNRRKPRYRRSKRYSGR